MTESQSRWQTQEVATAFLEGVRAAIPGADLQLEVMGKIVELWSPRVSRILDLGCGDGILGRLLLERFPTTHVTFTDFSEPMLTAVRDKVAGSPRATVIKADFTAPSWLEAVADKSPFDVVVSGFAIHHQPDARKKTLYAEIHGNLSPGGVFLNLEHVASATSSGGKMFDDFFVDHLLRFHKSTKPDTTRQEIEATYYNRPDKKENILAPVDVQCEWLRQIGFQDVDCFFKIFELAMFGGRKVSGSAPKPTPDPPTFFRF
jgi:ubiquinone/menaquinone biosynthesis C-methylase UbiE